MNKFFKQLLCRHDYELITVKARPLIIYGIECKKCGKKVPKWL